ncbi:hypothetical protein GCM10023143_25920 [Compostibacter hankyongensis]|uniref:Fibronectin type-III domain-containing protein n=1 Tax=Compostibacter hankyongensis TaxID=1007089 RepID=A0ABP8G0K4_9BACT
MVTLSEVQNPAESVTKNSLSDAINRHSTLRANVGALALIQAWQNLQFTGADKPAPTDPVTVKIGLGASILDLLGGVEIQATLNGNPVGTVYTGNSLLTLLGGANQTEVTFTPGVSYDGVRVLVKPTLGVGVTLDLYHAYFNKAGAASGCSATPIDLLTGVGKYIPSVDLAGFTGSVTNPQNAIDGNESTSATILAQAGVAAYTQETVIFSGLSQPGDSVRMLISVPGTLLEADLLNSIQLETFNGNTSTGVIGSGSGLLKLRLLSGSSNKAYISFAPNAVFNKVQLRLGGLADVFASLNLFEVKIVPARPQISIGGTVGDSISICLDQEQKLDIQNPDPANTYNWYDAPTGGTLVTTGTSYTAKGSDLGLGRHKLYVEAARTACPGMVSDRTEFTVNVVEASQPGIDPAGPINLCLGDTVTLTASSNIDSATYRWYSAATGGTLIRDNGTDTLQYIATRLGDDSLFAETVAPAGCVSATRTGVKIHITEAPVAPHATPADTVSILEGSTQTFEVANPETGVTYKWYDVSDGSLAGTGTSFTTPALTADHAYELEATNAGGCASPRSPLLVMVSSANPNTPCSYANQQQSPVYTGTINICLLCGVTNPDNAVDEDDNTASTIRANVGVGYIGQLLKFPHTYAAGDSVSLVLEVPGGVIDAQLLGNIRFETYRGTTANDDHINLDNSLVRLSLLAGGNKFRVTLPASKSFDGVLVSLGGALTALTSLNVYLASAAPPTPVPVDSAYTTCPGDSVTLSVNPIPGATISWYKDAVGGPPLDTGVTFTTPALTATTTYYVGATRFDCENPQRTPVTVTIANPEDPTVDPAGPLDVCVGDTVVLTASSNIDSAGYRWYDAATGGALIRDNGTDTLRYIVTDTGTVNLYVETVASAGCVSPGRTQVVLHVGAAPAAPHVLAADTVSVTKGDTYTFHIAGPNSAYTYKWYDAAGNPVTAGVSGADFTTPEVTADQVYYLEAVNAGGCASPRTRVLVMMIPPGTNLPCNAADAQTSPVFTGGALTVSIGNVYNAGNAVDNDKTTASDIRLLLGAGILLDGQYIGQLVRFQHAGIKGDSIRLIIGETTGLLDAGLNDNIRFRLYQGNAPAPGSANQSYNPQILDVNLLTGTSRYSVVLPADADYDGILVSIGGTLNAAKTLNLYYAEQYFSPAVPAGGEDTVTICKGEKATLEVTAAAGDIVNWYDVPTGGTALQQNSLTFETPNLSANTVYYAEVERDGCPSPVRTPVTVIVTNPPADPVPASANVAVCLGDSATLSVTNAEAGITYNWYSADSVLLHTGASITTGPVMADSVFYLEAANGGGCVNGGGRVKVTVTANPLPAQPKVSPHNLSVPAGTDATFTVQAPQTGIKYNWYNAATGGTLVHSGTTFTINNPTANATYYVEAVSDNGNGCPSATRDTVVLEVIGGGNSHCSWATSAEEYFTGIALGNLTSGAQAIDDNANTASDIRPILTALNARYGQKLTFPFTGKAGDTIRIKLSTGSTTLSLGLLQSISVRTFNGTTDNNDELDLDDNTLVKLRLLTSSSDAGIISFKATKDFNGLALYAHGTLSLSIGGKLHIYYAEAQVPDPEVTYTDTTVCQNESVTLQVKDPVAGVSYKWYDQETGGTPLANSDASGKTFTVDSLSADATYWVEAVRSATGCANPTRASVTVHVKPGATADDITVNAPAALCVGEQATLKASATGITNPVFSWYSDKELTHKVFTGATYAPELSATTTYYVTVQGEGVCENTPGNAKEVQVKVNPAPDKPVVASDNVITCVGVPAILKVTNPQAGVTFKWYTAETGGTALPNTSSPDGSTYTISSPAAADAGSYWVEAVNNTTGCIDTAGRVKVEVIVNALPQAPEVDSAVVTVCFGSPATLKVKDPQTGVIYKWYTTATGGAPVYQGASVTTSALQHDSTYYVEATNTNGCASTDDRTQVKVSVTPLPDAPVIDSANSNLTVCAGEKAVLVLQAPQTGVTYNWYDAPTGGTKVGTGATFTTPVLNTAGTKKYYAEAVNTKGGCINDGGRTEVDVTVNALPSKPVIDPANSTLSLCEGENVTLTLLNPQTGVTYSWYSSATGGTALATGTSFSPVPAPTANTSYWVEAVNANDCGAAGGRVEVPVTVNPKPDAPQVDPTTQKVLSGNTATFTISNPVTGVQYRWYDASGNEITSARGKISFTTPAITAPATFSVEAVSDNGNGCAGARTQLSVQLLAPGEVPCDWATMQEEYSTGISLGNLTDGDAAVDADANSFSQIRPIANVLGRYGQQLSFPFTIHAGDTVRIKLGSGATTLSLGLLENISVRTFNGTADNNDELDLDNNVLVKLHLLTGSANAGELSFAATKDFNKLAIYAHGAVNVSIGGKIYVYYASAPVPDPVADSANVRICHDQSATLRVKDPADGITYKWYEQASGGTAVATGTSFTTPKLTADMTYWLEALRGTCANPTRVPVKVTVDEGAMSSDITAKGDTLCAGESAALTASSTTVKNAVFSWYSDKDLQHKVHTGATYPVSPATTTTYYVTVQGTDNAGNIVCENKPENALSVTVKVNPKATAADITAPAPAPVCKGEDVTLSASSKIPDAVFSWYSDAALTQKVHTGATYTVTPTADVTYYVTVIGDGYCENAPNTGKAVKVTVNPSPARPTVESANVVTCNGEPAVLTVTNPQTGVDYKWYRNATGGAAIFTGASFEIAAPAAADAGEYWVEAVNSATGCINEGGRVKVTVTVNPKPAPPTVESAAIEICSGEKATLAISNPVTDGSVTYNWYDAATGGKIVYTGASVTTGALTKDSTYYVEAVNASGCGNGGGRTQVAVTVHPRPDAPVIDAAGSDLTVCVGQKATLVLQAPATGVIYNWYEQATGGTKVATGTSFTTPALTQPGVKKYYVEAVSTTGGCTNEGGRTVVNITVNALPAPPVIDPAASTLEICSDEKATLALKGPQSGVTYNWYASETGGTPIATGSTFTTAMGLTATTSFWVEAINDNDCGAAGGRVQVTVTVNPLPDAPAVTPTTASIPDGQTVTFQVLGTTPAGITYKWYDASGNEITAARGKSSYTTPALHSSTTYSVEAVNASGCSSQRVQLSVQILGSGEMPCSWATSEQEYSTGISLGNTNDGGLAVDNDGNTASDVRPIANVLGRYGQRLIFPFTVRKGDSVHIKLGTGSTTLSLGILNNVSVRTFNGTTDNNDETDLDDNALINLRLLTGGNGAGILSFVATKDFTSMAIYAHGAVNVAIGGKLHIYYSSALVPIPAKADVPDVTICHDQKATLEVKKPAAGVDYKWYDQASGGTLVGTGAKITTPDSLTASTTYWVEASRHDDGCANPTRVPVKVTVEDGAQASDIVAKGDTICAGESVTLTASSTTVTDSPVFTWYSDKDLKTKAHTGASFTLTPAATVTYYVTVQSASMCENKPANAKAVTVTVNPKATAADITVSAGDTLCIGESVTLTASSTKVKNGIFSWYTDSKLTHKVHTGASYTTSPTATTTYYVTVQGNGFCENAPDDAKSVKVTVNPKATAADIKLEGGGIICKGLKAVLGASSTTVSNPVFSWYTDKNLTHKVFTGATFETTPATTTTYYVTVQGDGFCENAVGDAASVTITVNPRATAGDISVSGNTDALCAGGKATLTASSTTVPNPVFSWYTDSKLTNKVFTGAAYTTGPLDKTTTFYVTVQGDGFCENAPDQAKAITVTVNPEGQPGDITVNGNSDPICAGEKATLTASSAKVPNAVFTWYSDSKLTHKVFTGATYTTGALDKTTTYYVAVQGDGFCENGADQAKAVTVTVNPHATAGDITVSGNDAAICAGTTATLMASSTTVPNPVFNWYTDSKLTDKVFTGATFEPTLDKTTTYYVTVQGDGFCENAPDQAKAVTVTVTPLPNPPVIDIAGSNLSICSGESATIKIRNPESGITYNWYDAPTGGTQVGTGVSLTTPALTATTDYYVEAVNAGGCGSATGRVKVTVKVNPLPAPPTIDVAASDLSVCTGQTATVKIKDPDADITYNWYITEKGGTPVATGTSFTTPVLTKDATYYVEAVNKNGCGSSDNRAAVTVKVSEVPDAPVIDADASDLTVCKGMTATLKIKDAEADVVYDWYDAPTGGNKVGSGSSFTTPSLSVSTDYYVEATNKNGCGSGTARTKVTVNVVEAPAAPKVDVTTDNICPGTPATLKASSDDPGVIFKWYTQASGGDAVFTGAEFTTPGLDATTDYYVEAVSGDGGCSSTTRTQATVHVRTQLPAPVIRTDKKTGTSITFAWNAVAGAEGYQVTVSKDGGTTFGDTLSVDGTTYTVDELEPTQKVTIKVRAIGETECENSAWSEPYTDGSDNPLGDEIFVPNAFTPNGDGNNDILLVYGNTITSMRLVVYNQWGQKVFESRDQKTGWDGTMNGRKQPVGVYVYYLEATLQDGKKVEKKGSITLIR